MTDKENQPAEDQDDGAPTEAEILENLKARADTMQLKYKANIGLEALRAKITAAMNDSGNDLNADEKQEDAEEAKSSAQLKAEFRREARKDARKLIRCRITNLNSDKKDLDGEIFTVSNRVIGAVRQYVPYNDESEDGFHLPNCIVKLLKAKKFLSVTSKRDPVTKQINVRTKEIREFAIEILPTLTKEQLAELKATQAAAGGM